MVKFMRFVVITLSVVFVCAFATTEVLCDGHVLVLIQLNTTAQLLPVEGLLASNIYLHIWSLSPNFYINSVDR